MLIDVISVPYRYDRHGEGVGSGPDTLRGAGLSDRLRRAGLVTADALALTERGRDAREAVEVATDLQQRDVIGAIGDDLDALRGRDRERHLERFADQVNRLDLRIFHAFFLNSRVAFNASFSMAACERSFSVRERFFRPRSCITTPAVLRPGIPVMPPPGWVPAPVR